MNKKIGLLMSTAAILVSIAVPSVLACHTWTPGYWKKHDFPAGATPMSIGGVSYTESQLRGILTTPPSGGDAWIILMQKVIAGKLSMLADPGLAWDDPIYFPGTDTFLDLITAADNLLKTLPNPCKPGASGRAEALDLASDIDYWLNYYDVD